MGDYSHLKNKKGELITQPLPQPTLPNLSVDDDVDDASLKGPGPPPSTHTQDYYYYSDKGGGDYPPMPAYNQPYSHVQDPSGYAHYNPSQATLGQDDYYHNNQMYDDDTESTLHLAAAAAPIGHASQRPGSALANPHSAYHADPHDIYQGRAVPTGEMRRPPLNSSQAVRPSSGLAYDDDAQDYPSPMSSGPPQRSFGQVANTPLQPEDYSHYPPTPQGYQAQQLRHGYGRDEESGRGGYPHAV